MKKKKLSIMVLAIMLIVIMSTSGCVTPTADFDTVKIVATVTRNGGDYTLNPSGESGYELHAVIGTLSIESLGMDIDQQAMKTMYSNAQDNNVIINRHMFGDGITGWFKGWWNRAKDGFHMNTVGDLAWADGAGNLGLTMPILDELGTVDYLGNLQHAFAVDTSSGYTLPNYGLGIYSATIPRNLFPNNQPTAGYVVLNDPTKIGNTNNGISVMPSGQNAAFVIWDGNDYKIIVLTNTPAFATSTEKKIYVRLTLVKPDLPAGAQATFQGATEFLSAYSTGLERQLRSSCSNLLANIEDSIDSAVNNAYSMIPGGRMVKSLSDFSDLLLGSGNELSAFDRLNMEKEIKLIELEKTIYATAWRQLISDVQGAQIKKTWSWDWVTINLYDGISVKELDHIIWAYTNDVFWGHNPIYQEYSRLQQKMNEDEANYIDKHDLNHFYNLAMQGTRIEFAGPVFSIQLVDDSYLAIIDDGTREALKHLLDLDFTDSLSDLNLTDLDEWRNALKEDIIATIQEVIPDYIAQGLQGIRQNVSDLSDEIARMNNVILEMELELKNLRSYISRLIPKIPKVSIFAYQVPSPVFTKIIGETGDFIQADPTSSFSAAVTVAIGDPTNWSLASGYPRAIIQTQSHGTLTVALQHDTTTDAYLLRQDMIGVENLSVGDTVKTYFEAKVTNGSADMTAHTLTYYTRICKSWLSEALDRLGITIDDIGEQVENIGEAVNWLSCEENPFSGGNVSGLDSHYALLTVKNEKAEDLYVKNPRKDFKMGQYDSETLVWEVRIFENEPYSIRIIVGNSSNDCIVEYSTSINKGEASWMNPLDWPQKIRELRD